MNKLHFVAAVTVLSITGCECKPPRITSAKGTVQWEWTDNQGPHVQETAAIDFGTISMGSRRDAALIIRNAGSGSFSLTEFVQIDGSPVAINGLRPTGEDFPAFALTFDPAIVLQPTETTAVTVSFTPPVVQQPSIDHVANLEVRPDHAGTSTLSLKGQALSDSCNLPDSIDFGTLPLGVTSDYALQIDNNSTIISTFSAGDVTDVPTDSYFLLGLENGQMQVPAGGSSTLTLRFSPTEPRDYNGKVNMRRAASCPEKAVNLTGRGVTSCLTWVPSPTDASGTILDYGAVPPSTAKEGTVTLQNACSIVVNVSNVRTNASVFIVNSAASVTVPAATRNEDGTWTSGSAVVSIDFQPTGFGAKQGLLLAATDLESQANITVGLKGFGGGPILKVVPDPTLAFGRVGFTPNSATPLVATRQLRVTNIGNQVTPADVALNLHIDRQPFTITATSGSLDELCIGDYTAATNTCVGGFTPSYDATNGIAPNTSGLNLPVRLIPLTAGTKTYELTIYSNDYSTPEKHIQITAEAVEAPPCDYSVTPATLDFGLVNSTASQTQTFTLHNNGTQASDICYFSAFDLAAGSDPSFSIVNPPTDIQLNPGADATISVQLAPTGAPAVATPISGAVVFAVPTASSNSGQVDLVATLSPSCLSIAPVPVPFGNIKQGCQSADKSIIINNACQTPVTYSGAVLTDASVAPNGTGGCTDAAGCPQFSLVSVPAAATIPAGGQRVITVRFKPYSQSTFTGNVDITLQTTGAPFVNHVGLTGTGIAPPSDGICVSASCPPPMTVSANTTVSLPVSIVSQGANTCSWSVASRPTTSSGNFTSPNSCGSPVTTYDADTVGTHVVQFTVTSGGTPATCSTPITVVPNGDLWVELTWQHSGVDLDLQLMRSTNLSDVTNQTWWEDSTLGYTHTNNFTSDTLSWGGSGTGDDPFLDRDDISGTGPENQRIQNPELQSAGVYYSIGVHTYPGTTSQSSLPVTATVRLYCGGSLVRTANYSATTQGEMWVIGTVSFPVVGGTCTVDPSIGLFATSPVTTVFQGYSP